MQKQSRVFFQISGAGHEALGLALARHLRPGYDWFFPYYRDQALCLGLGVTPTEVLLQAVGSADDPSSGGRQMPSHWGNARASTSSPSRARPAASASPPSGAPRRPATSCAGPTCPAARPTATSSPTCQPRRGGVQRGRVLGEPQHGVQPPPAGALRRGRQRLRHLGAGHRPASGAGRRAGARASAASRSTASTAPTTSACAARRRAIVERVRAGVGPALIHADVVRPYSHSAADTQSKYRSADELAAEAPHDPHRPPRGRARRRRRAHAGARRPRCGPRRKELVAKAAAEALAGAPARPGHASPSRSYVLPDDRPAPPTAPTTAATTVPMGEAIRRTLHEVMAADERIRVFGEDVADAREAVLADVEGKGGVFGTTHGLQRDVRPGPLLQHAAVGGQHRRPGRRARGCGACGRRPRSSSSTTSGRP